LGDRCVAVVEPKRQGTINLLGPDCTLESDQQRHGRERCLRTCRFRDWHHFHVNSRKHVRRDGEQLVPEISPVVQANRSSHTHPALKPSTVGDPSKHGCQYRRVLEVLGYCASIPKVEVGDPMIAYSLIDRQF
jgi:hypothetical protein